MAIQSFKCGKRAIRGSTGAFSLPLFGTLWLWSGVAAAQAQDPGAARALFQEARKAADASDYATACPKFVDSYKLDPGVGTLLNIADCERRFGRIATAWGNFQKALEQLPSSDGRRQTVERIATDLERRLPKLSVGLNRGAPPDSTVTRDGIDVGRASLGVAIPVDPGHHRVVVRASGRKDGLYEFDVSEGQTKQLLGEPGPAESVAPPAPVVAPAQQPASAVLAPAPAFDVVPAAASPAAEQKVPHPPRPSTTVATADPGNGETSTSTAQTKFTWISLGLGGAGMLVGTIAGIMVYSKKSELDGSGKCNDAKCSSSQHDTLTSYNFLRSVSTVGCIVGAVGVVGGVTLLLTAPSHGSTDITASVYPTSVAVTGRF